MTRSEQATLNFYTWEYWGRGHYLFETPVEIEPPYQNFQHKVYTPRKRIDDGQVPGLFATIKNLIIPEKEVPKAQVEQEVLPIYMETNQVPELVGFSISFPTGQDITPQISQELLTMLTFTEHPISFEIVGSRDTITIQMVSSTDDEDRLASQLQAYFPAADILAIDPMELGLDHNRHMTICDFGLSNEFMLPIKQSTNFSIDPLTSLLGIMNLLKEDDILMFQVIFKGITTPWGRDIVRSVSDGAGGSFFMDAPEMLPLAKEKASSPLFSAVIRVAAQSSIEARGEYLTTELSKSISAASESEHNRLFALPNKGYAFDFHWYNLMHRTSNRTGLIINARELATFVHYPNKTVISQKLRGDFGTTKEVSKEYRDGKYIIGENCHRQFMYNVTLDDQARLRHMHVIGATGTGKSTFLVQMLIQDMEAGNGCALFDPHGDIVEDVLSHVPEHRLKDVILIDPSDTECPVGFNLLHANTEAEKIVLSSDLTAAFKRYATAWGDNMSAVLQQAINAFLDSDKGGTLIELKRFLLEDSFRNNFLSNGITDPSIHYYWEHEYPMVRKRIAPLLTRIDTFLRPKIIRYMLAQNGGIDFRACIEQKKIVLIKLSQGLIGAENSYLLGSLFLSKFNQVAMSRQNLTKEQRHPFYIYLDEFQNFVTDSITNILSGARKYGLGLTLAHQELAQIDDTKVLNSVISNPFTRVCFRLGDTDARKLASGFSFFEEGDLQSLETGQAIVRIGSQNNDCNVQTLLPEKVSSSAAQVKRSQIVKQTRDSYGMEREKVEKLLLSLLPKIKGYKKDTPEKNKDASRKKENSYDKNEFTPSIENNGYIEEQASVVSGEEVTETLATHKNDLDKQKEAFLQRDEVSKERTQHRQLQNLIKNQGQQWGYLATIEKEIGDGNRIDVTLENDELKIACEISVTNSVAYEVHNIQKSIENNYDLIFVISKNENQLKNIQKRVYKEFDKKYHGMIHFFHPDRFTEYLDASSSKKQTKQEVVKGIKVETVYEKESQSSISSIRNTLKNILFKKRK